jgi:murein DD-endopeptidase MepM/ murein hydrolase activator NlpD
MKKVGLLMMAVFFLPLMATAGAGVEVSLLNPTDGTFLRGTGEPITETRYFPAAAGSAKIQVYNGAQDDTAEKVSSSIISINGSVVFDPSKFNQNVSIIESLINLVEGVNKIEVILKGKPGGRILINILQEIDADAAQVIGTEGGIIGSHSEGFELIIPADSLSENRLITVKISGLIGSIGTTFEFGPSGLSFNQPIQLNISYFPSLLPPDVEDDDLFIAFIDDYMEILQSSYVDKINNKVSATIDHFSAYALASYRSTGVNISDFVKTSSSFRMPIGDDGINDLGDNLSLITEGAFTNFSYPKVRINDNGNGVADGNEWYVAVAFNNDRWLNNGWNAEPSPSSFDSTCGMSVDKSSLYSCKGTYHPGEDWNMNDGNDLGKPIHAIADGVVLLNQSQGKIVNEKWVSTGFGNLLVVGHKLSNGEIIASVYAHLQQKSSFVPGSSVNKGDIIGRVGTSGGVPSHLHFEITKGNNVLLKIDNTGNIKVPALETNNKVNGWYWPGKDNDFIEKNYFSPTEFIQNYSPPTTVLFQDDFNDGNANGWIESTSHWSVVNGEYRVYISGYELLSTSQISGSENWSDYILELDVMRTDGVDFSLICGNVGFNFRTGWYWDGGRNYYFINGTMVGEFTFPLNVWHKIRVEKIGNNIKFYIKQKNQSNYLLLHDLIRTISGPIKLYAWTGHRALTGFNIDNVLVQSAP